MIKIKNFNYKITVESDKATRQLRTLSVKDKDGNDCNKLIESRGVGSFNDVNDMKDTLNWNLNGDSSKYKFQWGQGDNQTHLGYAYVTR